MVHGPGVPPGVQVGDPVGVAVAVGVGLGVPPPPHNPVIVTV